MNFFSIVPTVGIYVVALMGALATFSIVRQALREHSPVDCPRLLAGGLAALVFFGILQLGLFWVFVLVALIGGFILLVPLWPNGLSRSVERVREEFVQDRTPVNDPSQTPTMPASHATPIPPAGHLPPALAVPPSHPPPPSHAPVIPLDINKHTAPPFHPLASVKPPGATPPPPIPLQIQQPNPRLKRKGGGPNQKNRPSPSP